MHPTTHFEPALAASVRSFAARQAAVDRIPALSVAVADPARILCAVAVGHADLDGPRAAVPEDRYPWFSMTKIATATVAMQLYDEQLLDLDAPVGTYLRGYRPHPQHGHPSTRQLLTHTAGLGNPLPVRWIRPEDQPPDPELLRRIADRHGTPRRPVGARASYSNIGYLLAADVIEAVTGMPIEECVLERVLAPLGMRSTGYRWDRSAPRAVGYVRLPRAFRPLLRGLLPNGIVGGRSGPYTSLRPFLVAGAGYGGLIGTAGDAARLAAAHVAGPRDPHPVLGHDTLVAMRTITEPGKPFDHGTGWFRPRGDSRRSPSFVEHYGTGGGFWNSMRIYPERRLAVVAMANTTARWGYDALLTRIAEECSS
jgi:CubicO group peptidase (beta-lactamase class C family)